MTKSTTTLFLAMATIVLSSIFALNVSAMGKKYALEVGINNYPAEDERLQGAVNDARNMRNLLIAKFGFLPGNITMLLDEKATRDAILGQIKVYGNLVGPGDLFVFHYSGHGSLFPDEYSDVRDETTKLVNDYLKEDGSCCIQVPGFYDSTIVPWDHDSTASGKNWRGEILDDELYDLFAPVAAKGATVVFISDSCHSGTIGKAEKGKAKVRFLPTEKALGVKNMSELKLKKPANQRTRGNWNFYNRYIVLAAAKDDEYALDGGNSNQEGGMFTSTLVEVVNNSGKSPLTYRQLMARVGQKINAYVTQRNETEQHPQLDIRFGNGDLQLFTPPQIKGR